MNKTVNLPTIQKIMTDFARENERAEMTQEMMGDMLDDAMEEDGDEEEQDKIVGQVLDEIGISFGDKVPEAPTLQAAPAHHEAPAAPVAIGEDAASSPGAAAHDAPSTDPTVSDLEARLNNLRK